MAEGVAVAGARKKRKPLYICGLSDNECTGNGKAVSNGLKKFHKVHGSSEQAFKCYAAYLIRNGYEQIGPREFAAPNNGPVMVLTKKSKFGSRLRGGKGDRYMPEHNVGGLIAC